MATTKTKRATPKATTTKSTKTVARKPAAKRTAVKTAAAKKAAPKRPAKAKVKTTKPKPISPPDPSAPISLQGWQEHLKTIGDTEGFYENIGEDHSALFVRRGPTLIVTFENLENVYEHNESRMPLGFSFVEEQGWSFLSMMAHDLTWYRDEDVYDFFDRLCDEGFFDGFGQVIFYGASMGAYAASAFSAAATGATVIAVSPQATLERQLVSWETRYKNAWKKDFTSRYGYAPEMVKSACQVYLFFDPTEQLDSVHASLFQGANVQKFRCRYPGSKIAPFWMSLGVFKAIIQDCADGTLTDHKFYSLMRARKGSMRYRRKLLGRLQGLQRDWLIVTLCNYVLERGRGPKFRRARNAALNRLSEAK